MNAIAIWHLNVFYIYTNVPISWQLMSDVPIISKITYTLCVIYYLYW